MDALHRQEKEGMLGLLSALGKCPEVAEIKLEGYAIVTAMGRTYLWFQWRELLSLAEAFGMTSAEAQDAVAEMVAGAANTLFKSGMLPEEVMDLIPVKPLGEEETIIKPRFRS
jgi:pyrroline-5-carboxylate reductase